MNETLKKRLLSLLWRTLAMCGVVIITAVAENIGDFGLPDWLVVIIGLIAGEITKWLNTTYQLGSKLLRK